MANDIVRQWRTRKHRRSRVLPGLMAVMLVLFLGLVVHPQAFADATVTVTVSNLVSPRTIPADALGANEPQYIKDVFLRSDTPGLVHQAGIQILRFPGGSNADYYDWNTNQVNTGNQANPAILPANLISDPSKSLWPFDAYADPNMNFDAFMSQVKAAHADADITVNYGTYANSITQGANLAAAWVAYANNSGVSPATLQNTYGVALPGTEPFSELNGPSGQYSQASINAAVRPYNIQYWEIGNEVYGDGYYGNGTPGNAQWENDTIQGPVNYGKAVLAYANAMRAASPTPIKIGAVLTMPFNFPDDTPWAGGKSLPAGTLPWNKTVLQSSNGTQTVCNAIDFVAVHWYPQQPGSEAINAQNGDAQLLLSPHSGVPNNTKSIPSMMDQLKNEIKALCPADANRIQIRVTEANSVNAHPGKQTTSIVNSLFLQDTVASFLDAGAQSVDWWSLHNGFYQPPADIPGQPSYGTNMLDMTQNGQYTPYLPALNSTLHTAEINNLFPQGTDIPYGDFGLLSEWEGTPGAGQNGSYTPSLGAAPVNEPMANSPFPSYNGLRLLSNVYQPGGKTMLGTSSNSKIIVHAAEVIPSFQPPLIFVMVLNEDPSNSFTVQINLPVATIAAPPGLGTSFFFNSPFGAAPVSTFGGSTFSVPAGTRSFPVVNVPPYGSFAIGFWI